MIKAALHVHSTYSDGEFTLAELREKFTRAGCSVVCMADHADAFDGARVAAYVDEMKSLSDDAFQFIPGLEFGCVDRMHIAGFGVTALIDSADPQEVIAHIRASNGVCVIAHPPDHLFSRIEAFVQQPHGIEAWNSKYDGRYAPRPATFDLIQRMQRRTPTLKAFYGQDLHWRRQFAGMFTRVNADAPAKVLDALRDGAFEGSFEDGPSRITLPSNGMIPGDLRERFARASARTMRTRAAIKSVRKALGGAFTLLPAGVKAQLRRFF